jgi:hypothetical protein
LTAISKPSLLDSLRQSQQLEWFPQLGIGYLEAPSIDYGADYFEHYRQLDETPCGAKLTAMRIALLEPYWNGGVIDIGIGGGRFVLEREHTLGYDINPQARDWLKSAGKWCDPFSAPVAAVTMFDSLEHIRDPGPLLAQVQHYVFVSCPIFTGPAHVLESKHYKPGEHYWYFEQRGLETMMKMNGFKMLYYDTREQDAGRVDIGSAVFKRIRG